MKSKILTLILLIIAISVVISLGYDTVYMSDVLELKNLRISTYSGNNTRLSYVGMDKTLSAIKGYILSWYTEKPNMYLGAYFNDPATYMYVFGSNWWGQTFKVNSSGTLTTISILIYRAWDNDLCFELREVVDGLPTSNILDSQVIPYTSIPLGQDVWLNITLSNPIQVSAGDMYAIIIHQRDNLGDSSSKYYKWYAKKSWKGGAYPDGDAVKSTDNGGSWTVYEYPSGYYYDFCFKAFLENGTQISLFQVSFDHSINCKYTVAYESDVGKEYNTFNYTINIYHNVDTNQSWVLAYSVSYKNVSSFSNQHYVSPWIQMLSGSYTEDYHDYYWKIEVVVDAFDSITGSTLSKSSYIILSDQFYWQSYADFNGLAELVDTNMNVDTVIQPYSIILVIIIVTTYFIVNKRMMERD